jgi:hypothetical protein
MGKTKNEAVVNNNPQPETQEQPKGDFLQTLKDKGTVVISSPTREGLADIISGIPAEVKYSVGAVGRNYETQEFTLRLDLNK